jgi:phosphatidyl-myo-inositol dimannoside synthase
MQRVAVELAAALAEHPGVQCSSLVLRSAWRWTHLRSIPFIAGLLRRIPAVARRERVDAVLFSSMVTGALALPLGRRLRNGGVISAAIAIGRDVTLPSSPWQRLIPPALGALDLVFPISRATAGACRQRGLDPGRMHVVPCGVNPERFSVGGDRLAARRQIQQTFGSLLPGGLLLLSVGRQVERKGFSWFIEEVMPRLPHDVHYWLAGTGPAEREARHAARRQCLEDRVRFLGQVSETCLLSLYLGADLFIMPNIAVPGDIEGFGVVALEAGISGLPVVASRLDGIVDAVTEGENGHLVQSGDAGAFARTIMAYHRNRSLLSDAGLRASRRVSGHFAWARIADEYVGCLEALAAQRRLTCG